MRYREAGTCLEQSIGYLVTSFLIGVSLVGCSAKAPSGQVLAAVGSDEITTAQLSTAMGGQSNNPASRPAEAIALRALINQALMVRAAKDASLEQKPEVARQLDAAKRSVLAAAYAQTIVQASAQTLPSASQINSYYNTHPDLFAQRRILIVSEMGVPKTLMTPENVKALGGQTDPDQVSAFFGGRGDDVPPGLRILSPEQLTGPAAVLRNAHPGDRYTYSANGVSVFGRVEEERQMPLSISQARDAIAGVLQEQVAQSRLTAVLGSMRTSDVVKVGDLGKAILAADSSAH